MLVPFAPRARSRPSRTPGLVPFAPRARLRPRATAGLVPVGAGGLAFRPVAARLRPSILVAAEAAIGLAALARIRAVAAVGVAAARPAAGWMVPAHVVVAISRRRAPLLVAGRCGPSVGVGLRRAGSPPAVRICPAAVWICPAAVWICPAAVRICPAAVRIWLPAVPGSRVPPGLAFSAALLGVCGVAVC
jgi:hypothetical protein